MIPAIPITDRKHAGMNGIEATRQIRQHPGFEETPIVALSANAFMEQQREAVDAGMSDYLTKPTSLNKLVFVLEKHLPQKFRAQSPKGM